MNRYESGDYLENNPDWHQEDSPWKASQIHKMLTRKPIEIKSVADIGCGAGEILAIMAAASPDILFHGFDISPQALAIASRKTNVNLTFSQEDAFERNQTFDLAMAIDVFEHVEDPYSFLRGMRKISRYQMYHIPLDMTVVNILRDTTINRLRHDVGHIHYFNKHTALSILRETGHEIIDHFYTPGLDVSGKSWKSKVAVLPRKLLYSISPDLAVRTVGGWSMMVLTG